MMIQQDTPQAGRPESWLWQCIVEDHGQLSARDEGRLFAQQSTAIPWLVELIQDRWWLSQDAPGGGCAPIHAAELLGTLGATEAIPALLALLADPAYRELRDIHVAQALWAMGPAVLEPALRAHAESQDPRYRLELGIVIAALGHRDQRIFDLLVEMLAQEPEYGAWCLERYGDPRAIEHLSRVLDGYVAASGALTFDEVIALGGAIRQLGGMLTPAQERAYRQARREETLVREVAALLTEPAPGHTGAHHSYASSRIARIHAQATGCKRRKRRKQRKASRKRNRR